MNSVRPLRLAAALDFVCLFWGLKPSTVARATSLERRETCQASNNNPSSPLGQTVATPGALNALLDAGQGPTEFIWRHLAGDWGDLDEADKAENELSLKEGFRILSVYKLQTGVKV